MKLELTDVGHCRKKMNLLFDVGEVTAALEAGYQNVSRQVRIKGFRPGKAPRRALEKMFSGEAATLARKWLVEQNLIKVVEDEKLAIIGPLLDINNAENPKPGQPFTINLEMTVEPVFDLPAYKGLDLLERPIQVEDALVDQSIEQIRRVFAKSEKIEGPAGLDDILTVDIRISCGETELKHIENGRLRVSGTVLFDLPCPDLTEKFKGTRPGDVVRLVITLPADHAVPDLRGRPAEVEAKVMEVERVTLPELNDEFLGLVNAPDLETFRRRVHGTLIDGALREVITKQGIEIIEKLAAAADFTPPAEMVASQSARLQKEFQASWERSHKDREPASGGETLEEAMDKFRLTAEREALIAVKWAILAKQIARRENIVATKYDMFLQIEAIAKSCKTSPAAVARRIREFDGADAMMDEILSLKVIEMIRDNAKTGRLGPGRPTGETDAANAEAAESVLGVQTGA